MNLPEEYDKDEFARIQKAAAKIQSDSEVLIVIGIGGSYLGARAAIDFLNNSFVNLQSKEERKAPQILYAGNSISSSYLADLVDYVSDKDFSVNVISCFVDLQKNYSRNQSLHVPLNKILQYR